MKKEILTKGILMPLIIGIVLAVVFFVFFQNTSVLAPISNDADIAYHDYVMTPDEDTMIEGANSLADCGSEENIGTITFGKDSVIARRMANYSSMINSVSVIDGVAFGDGVTYIETFDSVANSMKNAKKCTYDGTFGKHSYTYVETKQYDGKYPALADLPTVNKGLVVLYQPVSGYGFSTGYNAMIFEEVE